MKATYSFINSNTTEPPLRLKMLNRFHCHITCRGAVVHRTLAELDKDVCRDKEWRHVFRYVPLPQNNACAQLKVGKNDFDGS